MVVVTFSSFVRNWGEVSTIYCPTALFFFVCLFVLKWRSARDHQSRFLGQDQSIVVQRAEMTVAECPLTSCMCARFPDMFPHYAWTAKSAHSDFVGSRVYASLGVTCYLNFWQNDRGLLCATAVTCGATDPE